MSKEVILVNPKFGSLPKDTGIPAGLLSVAAHTSEGIPVRIFDEQLEPIKFAEMEGSLVGIATMTAAVPRAKEIAQEAVRAGAYGVVFGGIHSTVCTQEMIKHGSVLSGEIEGGSWQQVVNDYQNDQELARVYYSPLTGLKGLPLARPGIYELDRNYRSRQISHSRGCSRGCDYCTVHLVAGKKTRFRPTEEVIMEMRQRGLLAGNPNVFTFFTNDNFGLQQDRALLQRIGKEIGDKPFKWFVQAGVDALYDKELLALVNSTGDAELAIGLESPFREGLATMKKGADKLDPIKGIANLGEYSNIKVTLLLMVGFDFEPENRFEEMLAFIKRMQPRPFGVYFSILTPLPGTKIAEKLNGENRIFDYNWGNYDTRHLVFQPRFEKRGENYGEMMPGEFMAGYKWLIEETLVLMESWQTPLSRVPIR